MLNLELWMREFIDGARPRLVPSAEAPRIEPLALT
jgi:hypothetical protein